MKLGAIKYGVARLMNNFLTEWNNNEIHVLVHTSGSTGTPKEMRVEKQKMLNSARITCDFLGLKPGDNALLCLSTDYIAGKMMVVRAIERHLNLHVVEPSNRPLRSLTSSDDVWDLIAMVPSQVYCTLQEPEERLLLMKTRHLIIGGGAINKDMEAELRSFPNAVWSTYGMTETLSHIALRRLSGEDASEWYTPFDSVTVSLNDESCLVINAPLVHDGALVTNDIAELSPNGREFRIIGRKDNVICSGGVKLHIEELERQIASQIPSLCASAGKEQFCVTKRPDPKFGEVAILLVTNPDMTLDVIKPLLSGQAKWAIKQLVRVPAIPMTPNGKIDRKAAKDLT